MRRKNLALTAATMSRSLEATLVFDDSAAAEEEPLATLGRQGQFSEALVLDNQQNHFAVWRNTDLVRQEKFSGLISKWLFPEPTTQPILHLGKVVGELRLTALDSLISHFTRHIYYCFDRQYSAGLIYRLIADAFSAPRYRHPPYKALPRWYMTSGKTATSPVGSLKSVSRVPSVRPGL